jgi:hypothetical protein
MAKVCRSSGGSLRAAASVVAMIARKRIDGFRADMLLLLAVVVIIVSRQALIGNSAWQRRAVLMVDRESDLGAALRGRRPLCLPASRGPGRGAEGEKPFDVKQGETRGAAQPWRTRDVAGSRTREGRRTTRRQKPSTGVVEPCECEVGTHDVTPFLALSFLHLEKDRILFGKQYLADVRLFSRERKRTSHHILRTFVHLLLPAAPCLLPHNVHREQTLADATPATLLS